MTAPRDGALPLRMLDLFSGRGGASAAMRERGWDVTRVEIDTRFPAEHRDIRAFTPRPFAYDLVWASPPCTEFSRESMPWCRTGSTPSLELVEEAIRVIRLSCADWWVIENVRGSLKYLRPLLGEPVAHLGPVFLWGELPWGTTWPTHVAPYKERLSSRRADLRSEIPRPISLALAVAEACERRLAWRAGWSERRAKRQALREALGVSRNRPLPLMLPLPGASAVQASGGQLALPGLQEVA